MPRGGGRASLTISSPLPCQPAACCRAQPLEERPSSSGRGRRGCSLAGAADSLLRARLGRKELCPGCR